MSLSHTHLAKKHGEDQQRMQTQERAAASESSKLHDLPVEVPMAHDRLRTMLCFNNTCSISLQLDMFAYKAPPCQDDEKSDCPQAAP